MTSQEEIDLKNHLIDEVRLHKEIMINLMGSIPIGISRSTSFEGIATLLGISSEYLFNILHGTM